MRENPFARENAKPVRRNRDSFAAEAEKAFRQFVLRPQFPCLGAKAALNSNSCTLRVYEELGSHAATIELSTALYDFTRSLLPQAERTATEDAEGHVVKRGSVELKQRVRKKLSGSTESRPTRELPRHSMPFPVGDGGRMNNSDYTTFVAIFEHPRETDEIQFEDLLWQQLRALHQRDALHFDWDPNVRSDPADPHFSFSFGGQALYVIGMHSNSSREARRFPWPALVFNPHEQFERLRADGKWKRMQETIRGRDLELQGTINPMLSDFGQQSEARQYSGRAVEEDWRAPFKAIEPKCPFAH
jgi:FPC/CPF motif-containing protein YcgG